MDGPSFFAAARSIPPGPGAGGFGSSRRSADDADAPRSLSVSFAVSTIRSDRVAVAKIDCPGALPHEVAAFAVTPGFEVDLLEERAVSDGLIIVGVRIHRRIGAIRRLCLVRFSVGRLSATASITVLH